MNSQAITPQTWTPTHGLVGAGFKPALGSYYGTRRNTDTHH